LQQQHFLRNVLYVGTTIKQRVFDDGGMSSENKSARIQKITDSKLTDEQNYNKKKFITTIIKTCSNNTFDADNNDVFG